MASSSGRTNIPHHAEGSTAPQSESSHPISSLTPAPTTDDARISPNADPESAMDDALRTTEPSSTGHQPLTSHSMTGSYRRASFVSGSRRPTVLSGPLRRHSEQPYITKQEREDTVRDERDLLQDNNLIPLADPDGDDATSEPLLQQIRRYFSSESAAQNRRSRVRHPTTGDDPSETSPLLHEGPVPSGEDPLLDDTSKQWEEAVLAGKIKTTWQREARTLASYSLPLIAENLLEYSLTVTSIFVVGHIGKVELGAASLASVTANITGYAIYFGLATSLDTLCAQAYGSGRKQLVGLQMQRMVLFLWCVTVPIGIIWFSATSFLLRILPDPEIAVLTGRYLKIILIGAPGFAAFESGKRFVQAQGLFGASMWVLLICSPLNAFLNWLFVWKLGWGFIGAPIAVAIVESLLPFFLILYVYLIAGRECWNGLTLSAFHNWGPMIRLSLPGLVMIEAEVLAFEILTLAASYLSTTHLAAQSVLASLAALTFQIPFPLSIAASTRVANLVGATLPDAARTAAQVAFVGATLVGLFNMALLSGLRFVLPRFFTGDADVIECVARVAPVCAAFQLFDALATTCNGILRGIGRQAVGGWVNLLCYYLIALPISFALGFSLHWELYGFWAGVAVGLFLVGAIEGWVIARTRWDLVVDAAARRNALG
ncbi:MAG: hypothetical protein M1833_005638 [Piccolia ochrophora]|nr:MAG: hypothetical protein M1833_005638 [Piccolia ochrophora]